MNKEAFLKVLNKKIKKLPKEEREDILQDYEDHFLFGLEEGKTEEEIVKALGSPSQIAKEILANHHLDEVSKSMTAGNFFRAMWAVIGLGFFNLVIVLGPALVITGLIVAGWIISLSFLISPLLVLIELIFNPGGFMLYNLFVSLAICGVGYFISLGMFYVTKFAIIGFVRYLKFNASLVKGG